ncbi:hypothetical protein CI610_02770 [invertebrate metagenome]|uniref:Uncharacterized protein n=1 Tax=invertebrate metagenome TaxID=1711999 RepID=A0A2H9T4Z1_9ZZZZ
MKSLYFLSVLLLMSASVSSKDFFRVNPPYNGIEKAYIGKLQNPENHNCYLYLKEYGSFTFYSFQIYTFNITSDEIVFCLANKPLYFLIAYILK